MPLKRGRVICGTPSGGVNAKSMKLAKSPFLNTSQLLSDLKPACKIRPTSHSMHNCVANTMQVTETEMRTRLAPAGEVLRALRCQGSPRPCALKH